MPSSRAAELGAPLLRREDGPLLRGEGRFVSDIPCAGALHAVFVRSGWAHAVLHGLDGLDEARAAPGVVAVLTAADLAGLGPRPVKRPLVGVTLDIPESQPYLARDRVRFVGEPVAMVIAGDEYAAADAAAMVSLDADPLPVAIAVEDAATDRELLFPEHGTNVARDVRFGTRRPGRRGRGRRPRAHRAPAARAGAARDERDARRAGWRRPRRPSLHAVGVRRPGRAGGRARPARRARSA